MALRASLAAAEANLATFGMVELAVRNPNVSSYISEWEGRALRAEAKLADEVRHADELAECLRELSGPCEYPDTCARYKNHRCRSCSEAKLIAPLLAAHAARRAHDSECESEFDSQVHAQTPCGCAARRSGKEETK